MAYLNKTQTPFVKMYIKENYKDMNDFISQNKGMIFDNSIRCFKELLTGKKKVSLYIQVICHGVEMDMEFIFSKDNLDVIHSKIIPYYVSIENYEKCQELLSLYDKLLILIGQYKEPFLIS
jgi:hypothetical protein